MPIRVYAATSNPGKLRDFATAAAEEGIEIEALPGLGDIPAPEEHETSFAGNARLKAEYYSRIAARRGMPVLVLADDSGLEVDALEGAPGVRSARFADDAHFGDPALTTDERNNLYLLARMASVRDRQAR